MNQQDKKIAIAIDGLSGCGKSTLAKAVADEFGLLYIDSGALYRLTAFLLKNQNEITEDRLCFLENVDLRNDGNILYNGRSYLAEIGLPEVNQTVSDIAQNSLVRRYINEWIRKKSAAVSVVMDGRDVGSVVLPDADIKIYMYSNIEYRMRQWELLQLKRYGLVDPELKVLVRKSMEKRDYDDLNRKVAPLICVEDALRFDMEKISLEEVFAAVCQIISEILV